MQLRNKTRSSSKVGYLVKAVSGGFEYAGVGDNPIGVVTNSVPSGAMCEIKTSGEAFVYVNRPVSEGNDLRLTIANEGGNAGVAQPVGNASVYTSIGTALQKGRGLIKVALNLASAGVIGGTGGDVPAGGSTGQVLVKNSAVDYDAGWSTFTAIGEASYSNPTPPRTSLVDTPAVAYARYNGTWVDSGLVIDRSGGTGVQLATVNYGERVTFVGDGTYISTNYSYAGTYAGVHEIAISFTPGSLGTMSQWYLNADTDSPRQILNDAEIAILGGTYINTGEVVFDSVTDLRWEMTIDIDTTALDGRYYTQTVADATFATQAWVSANYDNYSSWGIVDGIYTRDVISGDAIEFANGGDIQIQYDGYAGGVHTITFTYTGTPGSMDRWYFNTDHVDSPKSIQNDAEVYLIGGTGIDLSEVTYNTSDLRWEMTIANTGVSPWTTDTNGITYSGGNVGIGIASSATEELVVSAATDAIIRINSTKDGTWVDGDILGAIEFYGNDVSGIGAGVKAYIKAVEYSTFGAAFDLEFGTCDGSSAAATRMTIKRDGNIGIGTTTPRQRLDIPGTGSLIQFDANGGLKGTTSNPNTLVMYDNTNGRMDFTTTYATSSLGGFEFSTNGTQRMLIRGDGNIYTSAGIYADGEVESYDTSDIRLKENRKEISYHRSSRLLDISIIEFDHTLHNRHEIGLIAQEIQEIFPEVVREGNDGYLMLDYGRLIVPMLQIIQNQERRINDLERRFHVYK